VGQNSSWSWLQLHRWNPSPHDWPILVSITAWCLLSLYWDAAAKNAAPEAESESSGSRRVHLLLVTAAQILLFVPIPGLRHRLLPESILFTAGGLALQAMGILFAVWARRCLGRNWSGRISIKVEHQLVRTGPYRVLRHPIYTGFLGLYAGVALVSGEVHALMGLALALAAYLRKVRLEEANLMRAFGDAYRAYRKATWALLPWVF